MDTYTLDLHNSDVSSDPSLQSEVPSQMDVISIHWPDEQRYSSRFLNNKNTFIFLQINSFIII